MSALTNSDNLSNSAFGSLRTGVVQLTVLAFLEASIDGSSALGQPCVCSSSSYSLRLSLSSWGKNPKSVTPVPLVHRIVAISGVRQHLGSSI